MTKKIITPILVYENVMIRDVDNESSNKDFDVLNAANKPNTFRFGRCKDYLKSYTSDLPHYNFFKQQFKDELIEKHMKYKVLPKTLSDDVIVFRHDVEDGQDDYQYKVRQYIILIDQDEFDKLNPYIENDQWVFDANRLPVLWEAICLLDEM